MHPEALILRRCYPVPVTFADLRAAHALRWLPFKNPSTPFLLAYRSGGKRGPEWVAAIKQITSAIDEVYAVVDGREVRVAVVQADEALAYKTHRGSMLGVQINDLLIRADEQGYWERPHEVRLDLSPRLVSHDEVARAVLVGQEAMERGGVVRL